MLFILFARVDSVALKHYGQFYSLFQIKLFCFLRHAARVGWDPYNGQINRYRNEA